MVWLGWGCRQFEKSNCLIFLLLFEAIREFHSYNSPFGFFQLIFLVKEFHVKRVGVKRAGSEDSKGLHFWTKKRRQGISSQLIKCQRLPVLTI